jgi:antitoxin HicB
MNPNTVEYYLNLPYTIEIVRDNDPENPGWVARVAELSGCITQADDFNELGEMIQSAMRLWIQAALEDGYPIPEPRPEEDYSGKFVVRVPTSLHRKLALTSEREGVSLNSYINVALASYANGKSIPKSPLPAQTRQYPGLSAAAYHILSSEGLIDEAQRSDEQLFGNWLKDKVNDLEKVYSTNNIEGCLHLIDQILENIVNEISSSPVIEGVARLLRFQETVINSQAQSAEKLRATAEILHSQIDAVIGQVNLPKQKLNNAHGMNYSDVTTRSESTLADALFQKTMAARTSGTTE